MPAPGYQSSQLTTLVDGPSGVPLTTQYDYDGSGNLIYQGWAYSAVNPQSSQPVWAIKKFTYNGSSQLVQAQWVNGDSGFNYIWANRASLSFQ